MYFGIKSAYNLYFRIYTAFHSLRAEILYKFVPKRRIKLGCCNSCTPYYIRIRNRMGMQCQHKHARTPFFRELNISPLVYIRKKQLANATKLLSDRHSVTEAAELNDFADCSNFIFLFKKAYQITPLQYKK